MKKKLCLISDAEYGGEEEPQLCPLLVKTVGAPKIRCYVYFHVLLFEFM